MDIFNRPPAISEDTLFYELYPPDALADKASVTTLAVVMQDYVDTLLPSMQWHRDTFELKVNKAPDSQSHMLAGSMRVGDCIDDEWRVVWVLREISSKWDVAIRIFDTDGEFLLIEAAEHLPPWISPNNAVHRVWIYGSHMHIVPLKHISSSASKAQYKRNISEVLDVDEGTDTLEDFISAQDAVIVVRDSVDDTRVSPEVEQAVWNRISGYPAATRAHVHHTTVVLPVDVARALSVRPALVQKAVETFYTRDALQLRAAHRMSRFPPEPSVRYTTTMTRTAYAQLMGQKFFPPKVFGRITESEGTPAWRWRDIGMKIACGFEMLYQEIKGRTSTSAAVSAEAQSSAATARREALRHNADYRKYIENLKNTGYFRGELEGSKLWTELEDKATAAFVDVRQDDDTRRPSFASQVDAALQSAARELEESPEDPDDWLNVDAEDFDAILASKLQGKVDTKTGSSGNAEAEDVVAGEQASRLKSLASKVEEFIEGEGDLEGAHFADELLSDEEPSDDDGDPSDADIDDESDSTKQARKQAAMDALVPGIKPSEYGQMPPSFHRHSQRVARDPANDEERTSPTSPQTKPSTRPPILPRDKYDGVDSDDESDEQSDDEGGSDDERPLLVDDVEIDMSEEQDEFLEFARDALGVTSEHWQQILEERRDRGAFIPKGSLKGSVTHREPPAFAAAENLPQADLPKPAVGPKLDSFETLMRAMDAELARSRSSGTAAATAQDESSTEKKGKQKATVVEDDDLDIEAAIDAELRESLQRGMDEDEDLPDIGGDPDIDYNLIKNFLESFKSQAGLSGPVGNLASRLQPGWAFPRDSS